MGHNYNPTINITVGAFCSPDGYVLFIKDKGKGFDADKTLKKMLAGEKYYYDLGSFFMFIHADPFNTYSYNTKGNEVYMFSPVRVGKRIEWNKEIANSFIKLDRKLKKKRALFAQTQA